MARAVDTNKPEEIKEVAVQKQAEKELQSFEKAGRPANQEELIIFEQIKRNYTNRSVVKTIDTQFRYFSFPPSTTISADNFDVTLPDLDLSEFGIDPVSGFHRVPLDPNLDRGNNEYRKINLSYGNGNSWNITPENPQGYKGPRRIPFEQTLSGTPLGERFGFVLTPEIISLLNDTNKVIRFTVGFSVNQKDTGDPKRNTGYLLQLERDMPTKWRRNNKIGADGKPIFGSTNPRSYQRSQDHANYTGFSGSSYSNMWPYIKFVYIIDPTDMFDYDTYFLTLETGGPAWYLRSSMFWNVELIDDPGKGLLGTRRSREYGKIPTNYRMDIESPKT
jgi:hypothetical protein